MPFSLVVLVDRNEIGPILVTRSTSWIEITARSNFKLLITLETSTLICLLFIF